MKITLDINHVSVFFFCFFSNNGHVNHQVVKKMNHVRPSLPHSFLLLFKLLGMLYFNITGTRIAFISEPNMEPYVLNMSMPFYKIDAIANWAFVNMPLTPIGLRFLLPVPKGG